MITSFRLPDSTLVYLNSGSVLKYPSIFTGNIREVSLNGEAYFEVAKDPEHKFIVSTPQNLKWKFWVHTLTWKHLMRWMR